MSGEVIQFSAHRAPVRYAVEVVHHHDGRLELLVYGVSPDERSREACAYALRRAADLFDNIEAQPQPEDEG